MSPPPSLQRLKANAISTPIAHEALSIRRKHYTFAWLHFQSRGELGKVLLRGINGSAEIKIIRAVLEPFRESLGRHTGGRAL